MPGNKMLPSERREASAETNGPDVHDFREASLAGEEELLRELIRALRSIRFGSIILTLHDGRIVEIQKTERIRRTGNKANSASAGPK
jgi:hypothetical protein